MAETDFQKRLDTSALLDIGINYSYTTITEKEFEDSATEGDFFNLS